MDEDAAVEVESEEDPFKGRPPYHSMTCATCLHLVEDNACIALPPMPVLTNMIPTKQNDQLVSLSGGKVGRSKMEMRYTAVYPSIARPDNFRACSMYVMDAAKFEEQEKIDVPEPPKSKIIV